MIYILSFAPAKQFITKTSVKVKASVKYFVCVSSDISPAKQNEANISKQSKVPKLKHTRNGKRKKFTAARAFNFFIFPLQQKSATNV